MSALALLRSPFFVSSPESEVIQAISGPGLACLESLFTREGTATMTVAQVKTYLQLAVVIGKVVAPRTDTKIDDKAVEIVERLSENDALLNMLIELLDGREEKPSGLSDADSALADDLLANKAGVLDLVRAASAVCG